MLETTDLGTMVKILPLSKTGIARLCEEQADGDRFVHLDFDLHPISVGILFVGVDRDRHFEFAVRALLATCDRPDRNDEGRERPLDPLCVTCCVSRRRLRTA